MISWHDDLVSAIARRRSVILIGSGVSANALTDKGDRPPTWSEFLHIAYRRIGKPVRHISDSLKRNSFLEACDYLKSELGENWNNLLREFYKTPNYRSAKIHEAILNLDSRIVASLNFDRIYDQFALRSTEGTVVVKNYFDNDIREAICGEDRYILKPHGSIDSLSKVIFTLEDYGRARNEYSNFYEVLNALLHTHTFLCLGCGLSDPDMQLIFEDYRYKHNEAPHFIVMPGPIQPAQRELIKKTRGMNPLVYSPKEHHKELTDSLFELVDMVELKRIAIAGDQNW